MKGYTRDEYTTALLIEGLRAALHTNPNQRLGQLLANLARYPDGSQRDLWNVYDEEWIELLAARPTEDRP